MNYRCSEGILVDKIICDLDKIPNLSQQSLQNCPKCGHPVDGHYCQGCALLQKKFKEDLFTSCVENGILQDYFKPSNDNTNVVNALREPFVVNQDPVLIVPDPKPLNNQTIEELPPTLLSFESTCYSKDGNSFTYDSTSNLVQDSPNVFDPPSQLTFYSCEFCENDARYGYYCTPQVPFVYLEPCYNQVINLPQEFHDFQQQDLYCENCRVIHEACQCQPMNEDYYHEQKSFYDPNSLVVVGYVFLASSTVLFGGALTLQAVLTCFSSRNFNWPKNDPGKLGAAPDLLRSKQPFILEESHIDTMVDQLTMAKLLCAPTEGYAEAIVVPPILADQFELKHSLTNMMTSDQFFKLEKDNPHDHILNQQTSDVTTAMTGILKQFQATPLPASVKPLRKLVLLTVVLIRITSISPQEATLTQNIGIISKDTFQQPLLITIREIPFIVLQASLSNQTNEIKNMMAGLLQMNTASTLGSGSLPSNTVSNPKGKLKAITTQSGRVLDGPTVPTSHPIINPDVDERVEETLLASLFSEAGVIHVNWIRFEHCIECRGL
nr:reverse transcriptase domain-containing protein [Tanacetum cinerariifolium]